MDAESAATIHFLNSLGCGGIPSQYELDCQRRAREFEEAAVFFKKVGWLDQDLPVMESSFLGQSGEPSLNSMVDGKRQEEPEMAPDNEAPRCKKHPAEPQIQATGKRAGQFLGQCRLCMAETAARRKGKPRGRNLAQTDRQTDRQTDLLLTLDLGPYPEVMERLREDAKEQMRTPEMQAVWLLRAALAGTREP